MRDQRGPMLDSGAPRWNSRVRHAHHGRRPAAVPPGLQGDRAGDRARRAGRRRPPALRAVVLRRARGQPRHRAPRDRGAGGRRPRRGTRARHVRPRRRPGRAAEHADEPLGARPLARAGGDLAGARLHGASGHDRRGGGVRDRSRRGAARARAPADAGRAADLAGQQPRTPALPAAARRGRLRDGLAVRRARADGPSARPRRLRAGGARGRHARGGAAGARRRHAGAVRDHRRDRRGRPGRRPGEDRLSRRPLSIPGDAHAPHAEGQGEGDRP